MWAESIAEVVGAEEVADRDLQPERAANGLAALAGEDGPFVVRQSHRTVPVREYLGRQLRGMRDGGELSSPLVPRQGMSRSVHSIGLTFAPRTHSSQCRCGPVERRCCRPWRTPGPARRSGQPGRRSPRDGRRREDAEAVIQDRHLAAQADLVDRNHLPLRRGHHVAALAGRDVRAGVMPHHGPPLYERTLPNSVMISPVTGVRKRPSQSFGSVTFW